MPMLIVSPLSRIGEMAVRHRCREMVSLLAKNQAFHRPAVIAADRHLLLGVNDISFAGNAALIAPQEEHVRAIVDFSHSWDRTAPLLVHCWMGVSRSPAAAAILALAVEPEQDEMDLARRLRAASAYVTPNARLIEIGDHLLSRGGRLIAAIKAIGRGAEADGNAPFLFSPLPEPVTDAG